MPCHKQLWLQKGVWYPYHCTAIEKSNLYPLMHPHIVTLIVFSRHHITKLGLKLQSG